uniref:synaptotagmin-16-like isoform X3 n=1 Tax=Ciona intestinalis TaxID=7719 RepID=UPI000EF492C0|nr:synaptotagmin-16-like isoform X3 [Ciona intestinalis]|eukprot:XP_026693770.1 synaptotagmin-16-like isoform X3 [Ciona intestinalis]
MSTAMCCFHGLFAHMGSGGSSFSRDVVAVLKTDRAAKNRKQTVSVSSDDSLNDPDEIVENWNDSSSKPRLSITADADEKKEAPRFARVSTRIKNSMRAIRSSLSDLRASTTSINTNNNNTKSFDDSDSDSSDDSEEETMRQMRKTVRRSSARKNNGSSSDIIDDQQPSTSNIDTTLNTNPSTPSSGEKQMNEQQTVMDGTSPNEAPKQMESPASHVSTNDGKEWNIDDSESVYSRELSSSLMEEDEVAVAIAAKPSPLDGDSVDISMEDTTPISACGVIDIAVQYSISDRKLQITIIEAKELPSKDRGGASIIQVRAVMLPAKRKRYKTKVQHINSSRFAETFKVSQVSPEELRRLGLRVRLYGIGKVRDRLIGEATVRFDELNLIRDPQLTVTLQLEPRTDVNRGDQLDVTGSQGYIDTSSVATLAHGGSLPELLLSLSYNEMTGRLCVEVVKGSHFRNLAMSKPPGCAVPTCRSFTHGECLFIENNQEERNVRMDITWSEQQQ